MDLEAFFVRPERYDQFKHHFTFFSALRGLAHALSKVHSLRLDQHVHGIDFEAIGYHHDVRPANILVSDTTLVLADFGLGNVKHDQSGSHTPFKPGTGDYLAPEIDLDDEPLTRGIDVWAFGCLIAEVGT